MPLLEGEDPWPIFGKVSVLFEGFVYYSQYSTKVILHDLAKWFPNASIHSHIQHTVMMTAAVMSFLMGYMADDLVGKYRMVFWVYMISTLAPLAAIVSLHCPGMSVQARSTSFLASLYFWFPVLAVEATRVALVSEQFKIPQALRSLKMFFFLFMVNRYAGSGFAGVLMKVEKYFGSNKSQLTIRIAILAIVAICYTAALLYYEPKIRKKRLQIGVVDGVIACIFSALYNRAFRRRKMPPNTKWIDYSDGKYYKETKDSALQLVQMSFIYMPFSVFFGLNEFLDVIWMEQNEWIGSPGDSFLSGMSIITVYHAVDVVLLPLFEYLIEFVLPKCNIVLSDLQLIGSSIFLLGMAYLATTILHSVIENGDAPPEPDDSVIRFFNSMGGPVTISTPFCPTIELASGDFFEIRNARSADMLMSSEQFTFPIKLAKNDSDANQIYVTLKAVEKSISTFIITEDGVVALDTCKEPSSNPVVDIINGISQSITGNIRLKKAKEHKSHDHGHHGDVGTDVDEYTVPIPKITTLERRELAKGEWTITMTIKGKKVGKQMIDMLPRQRLTLFICYDKSGQITFTASKSTNAKSVVLWYAFPQIILRSFADGIGKISTYYFTYTQSPRKLRATAFGVLYFAQFALPSIIGMVSEVWMHGLSTYILSLYTFIVFLALVFFIRFSLKYEEI